MHIDKSQSHGRLHFSSELKIIEKYQGSSILIEYRKYSNKKNGYVIWKYIQYVNEGEMSFDYVIIAFFSSPLCLKMATPGLPVDLELKKVSNKLTITIGWGLCESHSIYQIPSEMGRQIFETFLYAFEGAHAKLFSSNSQFFPPISIHSFQNFSFHSQGQWSDIHSEWGKLSKPACFCTDDHDYLFYLHSHKISPSYSHSALSFVITNWIIVVVLSLLLFWAWTWSW